MMASQQHQRDDVFQRLTFGQTYSRAWAIFGERWDVFLMTACLVFLPYTLFMISYLNFLGQVVAESQKGANDTNDNGRNGYNSYSNGDASTAQDPFAEALAHTHGEMGKLVAEMIFYLIFGILGGAAMSHAVAAWYTGQYHPTLKECWKQAFGRFCQIFGASALVGVGVAVVYFVTILIVVLLCATRNAQSILLAIALLICFFVTLIYVYVAMMLATPVIMVENKGPVDTIARCWELANNSRCFIFCTLFVFVFCFNIVTGVVNGLVFSGNPMGRFTAWGALLQTLPMIVLLPATIM